MDEHLTITYEDGSTETIKPDDIGFFYASKIDLHATIISLTFAGIQLDFIKPIKAGEIVIFERMAQTS